MPAEKRISRIKIDDTCYEIKDELVRYILSDISKDDPEDSDTSSERG